MTMNIALKSGGHPGRPRLAAMVKFTDRRHLPHHLRPTEVGSSRLDVEAIFSAKGGWVEIRIEEEVLKSGGARPVTKVISNDWRGEDLRALCDFFAHVREQLDAAEELERARKAVDEEGE